MKQTVYCILLLLWTYVVHSEAQGTTFQEASGARTGTRALQQQTDFECELGGGRIGDILDRGTRTWTVDDSVLEDNGNDLQQIVNCSEEGDVILFDISGSVQFVRRVILPWRLTLSAATRRTNLVRGVFPEADQKLTVTCPEDEGAFLIQAEDVLFANLAFEDCSLDVGETSAAIVEVDACDSEQVRGNIQMHRVEFNRNRLNGSAGLFMNTDSCSDVEWIDVQFTNNTCTGVCGAVLSSVNTLTNVRIQGNTQINEASTIPAILYAPPESETTAEDIIATQNDGAILHIDRGELVLTNGSFTQNIGEFNQDGDPYGASVHLDDAIATIRRCRFEENRAAFGAAVFALRSRLTMRNTMVERNIAVDGGAGVYLFRCRNVDLIDCTFAENSILTFDGAGLRSNATQALSMKRCTFSRNAAGTGAAAHVFGGSLEVEDSIFDSNNASVSAGAVYFEGTTLRYQDSVFVNNSADEFGGASHIRLSDLATVLNMTCVGNSATFGGCLRLRETSMFLNDSLIQANTATDDGGGISAAEGDFVHITNSVFQLNIGDFGGGFELNVDASEIRDTRLIRNNATSSGGGCYVGTGSYMISNCTFSDNGVVGFGGGITCAQSARMNVSSSFFLNNEASIGGAGSNIISSCFGTFTNSTWTSNRAVEGNGGGALVEGGFGVYSDSLFERNRAVWGGGAFLERSRGLFSGIQFLENNATTLGGGLSGRNGTGIVSDSVFLRNGAQQGGAVFFGVESTVTIQTTTLTLNAATRSGGGIEAAGSSVFNVSDSVFGLNTASISGGAISLTTATLNLRNVTVVGCSTGSDGGGLAAFTTSIVNIGGSTFSQNECPRFGGSIVISSGLAIIANTTVISSRAGNKGGGVYVESAIAVVQSSNISDNFATNDGGGILVTESTFRATDLTVFKNTADANGGGVYVDDGSTVELTNISLIQNRSPFGGGLAFEEGSSGTLTDAFAYNNSALTSGGVAYIELSNLTVTGGQFIENEARFGGGFVLVDESRFNIQDASFVNCSATSRGGAISGSGGSFIVVENSTIVSGTSVLGAAVALTDAFFWGHNLRISDCEASSAGGTIYANLTSSVLCSGCIFENSRAVDKGGGVFLEAQTTQLLAFQFDNCSFVNNTAALGGGLHFVNADGGVDCAATNANCTFVALRGTEFIQNSASSAGGAILSSDLNAIRVNCSYEAQDDPFVFINREQFESLAILNTLESICPSWQENEADVYGDTLASYARRVNKMIRFEERDEEEDVEGNIYILQNHLSGTQIPSLFMTTVDELGQGPARGAGNETIEATMWSPDRLFTGSVGVSLQNGVGNFSGLAGFREAGFYDVRVDFSEASIPSFTMLVEVRGCMIGEAVAANGTICQPCNGDTYNFFPDRADPGCVPCPDDAKCDTAVIRPKAGFWHMTPCSSNVQECLTRRGCDAKGRDEALREIGRTVENCNFSSGFIENYLQAQCKEGYEGPLCGSCKESFGRSRSFRCERCFNGFGNFVLVLMSVVVLLILSGFAIRSSLPSHRRVSRINRPPQRGPPAPPSETYTPSSPPVNLQMVQMMTTGHVPRHILEGKTEPQRPSPQSMQRLAELAKWKAVEIFKITINYLQVIAVAISINVDWTDALVAIFETAEFLGGVTSEAATRSVDCLISSDSSIPRSAVRTVVNIMVPMIVTAVYFLFWAIAMMRVQEAVNYLIKRCILSFMAVSYLSYIAITKTAVNVLYCVDVHDSIEVGSEDRTEYWAVDTALKCYEGSHTVLAALIGWPVLIIFSFGFPVTIAAVLFRERRKHDMKSEWLYESTGFVYRAYSKQFVFWEAIIMLRKAVLAVVVVFSYPLGGNLQGVLGVCVLMIALYFQIVCGPFREEFDDLNMYEGLSLLVCSLTFVSGLFFNDDRTSEGARVLLTVFLIFANFGIFVFFNMMFFRSGAAYLKTLLDSEGTDYDPNKGSVHVVRIYFRSRLIEYFTWWKKRRSARQVPASDLYI